MARARTLSGGRRSVRAPCQGACLQETAVPPGQTKEAALASPAQVPVAGTSTASSLSQLPGPPAPLLAGRRVGRLRPGLLPHWPLVGLRDMTWPLVPCPPWSLRKAEPEAKRHFLHSQSVSPPPLGAPHNLQRSRMQATDLLVLSSGLSASAGGKGDGFLMGQLIPYEQKELVVISDPAFLLLCWVSFERTD